METSSLDGEDAGSNESLINDEDKGEPVNIRGESNDDSSSVDEEEESIQLLLDALDYTENASEQKRKPKTKRNNDSCGQEGNATSYESVEASELDSENNISQLNLVIPKINFCAHGNASSSENKPRSAITFDKRAIKLLKKHESESGKIFCGIIVIVLLLGSCACLLVLGYLFDMGDLYIIAGILGAGGFLFTIAFIIVRCQTHDQIEHTDYSVLFKTSP